MSRSTTLSATFVALGAALAIGCGGATPAASEPTSSEPTSSEPTSEPTATPACTHEGEGPCEFVVGDCCYADAASACAAAGCDESHCEVLESYPAQIRCGS